MALSDTIKNAVDTAFREVDDLTQTVTYTYPGTTSYNPATGRNEGISTSVSVKAVFVSQPYAYDSSIKIEEGTPQILIKTKDFTTTLSTKGSFLVGTEKYDVIDWSVDPANALYTITVVRSV